MLDLAQTTYRRIVDVTAEEIERELESYIFQNALPDVRTDGIFSGSFFPGDLTRLISRVSERFAPGAIEHAFQSIAKAVDGNSYEKLARVPGIDASKIVTGGANALTRFRETNIALIRTIPEKMASDVGAALASQPITRLHVREAGQVLQDTFKVSANQAEFWARDQTLKLYADVNQDRHAAAGVTRYEWGTSDDERVRGRPGGLWAASPSNHFVLDKTIQRWDAPPVVDAGTGRRCHPGKDYECRCTAYPHLDE